MFCLKVNAPDWAQNQTVAFPVPRKVGEWLWKPWSDPFCKYVQNEVWVLAEIQCGESWLAFAFM